MNGSRDWPHSGFQRLVRTDVLTHFLDEDGFLIDDMIFAVVNEHEILGVPNASMIDVMWSWFTKHLPADKSVTIENLSEETSILALQGPDARKILDSSHGRRPACRSGFCGEP